MRGDGKGREGRGGEREREREHAHTLVLEKGKKKEPYLRMEDPTMRPPFKAGWVLGPSH
jgi:hypothetical protein